MTSKREAPQPWASVMTDRGFVHGRRPSMRKLALRAGVSPQTVIDLIFGEGDTEVETIEAVSHALGVGPEVVSGWAGIARQVHEPWAPPSEASLLHPTERKALDHLIRVMTTERQARDNAAPMTQASGPISLDSRRTLGKQRRAPNAARKKKKDTEGNDS